MERRDGPRFRRLSENGNALAALVSNYGKRMFATESQAREVVESMRSAVRPAQIVSANIYHRPPGECYVVETVLDTDSSVDKRSALEWLSSFYLEYAPHKGQSPSGR